MNYQLIYNNLIETRKQNPKKVKGVEYFELHHIVPKCLGGGDTKQNLVQLTAREHYLAHWLLTKIYADNYKLWAAFSLMSGKLSPLATREFTASAYERCKKAHAVATSLRMKNGWNPGRSTASRDAARNRMLNSNPISADPSLNHTAYPVTVYMEDGRILDFEYGVQAAHTLGIPYSTWKWSRKHGKSGKIRKYKVHKIVQHKDN